MSKTVTQTLYKIECDAECGFLVRNHNENELLSLAITHCVNTHNKAVTADDLRPGMKRA